MLGWIERIVRPLMRLFRRRKPTARVVLPGAYVSPLGAGGVVGRVGLETPTPSIARAYPRTPPARPPRPAAKKGSA